MIEEHGRIVFANPAYARLVDHGSPEEVIGIRVSGLTFHPPARDGSKRDYDFLHFDFRDGRRKLRLHVARDVTDRRALETRLRESEKLEALGRLVGGVAHDFNNILTAIRLHAELLRDRQPDAGGRHLEEVLQAAQGGSDFVRQLLTFARQHPASMQVLCLRDVLDSMTAVIRPLIGEDIKLVLRFPARRHFVSADAAQLQQVFLNLVMNARDAMRNGGQIRIGISSLRLGTEQAKPHGLRRGNYVCLTVEDNGCGMSDEVRARVFEPFFTTKKPGAGTGLGMSTVYGIVGAAGGAVWVASTVGKGTRVSILLPEVQADKPSDSTAPAQKSPGGNETILLAEDDKSIRSSLSQMLRSQGYQVLAARDGLDALQIARSYKSNIDLLLSDVVMPRLGGPAAITRIHRHHPEARVLFISGYPNRAADGPATRGPVLYKPFSRAVLAQKVREALDHRPPSRRTARGPTAARGAS